jgi:hypothetical protein
MLTLKYAVDMFDSSSFYLLGILASSSVAWVWSCAHDLNNR